MEGTNLDKMDCISKLVGQDNDEHRHTFHVDKGSENSPSNTSSVLNNIGDDMCLVSLSHRFLVHLFFKFTVKFI